MLWQLPWEHPAARDGAAGITQQRKGDIRTRGSSETLVWDAESPDNPLTGSCCVFRCRCDSRGGGSKGSVVKDEVFGDQTRNRTMRNNGTLLSSTRTPAVTSAMLGGRTSR